MTKVLGIGVDFIENKRISALIKNQTFLKRTFSTNELRLSRKIKHKKNFFAKRFAAKEAFSKALGTGISKGISFNEIIVLNKKSGKPYIRLIGKTKKITEKKFKKKKYKISVSLSDEKNYALAFVTIS